MWDCANQCPSRGRRKYEHVLVVTKAMKGLQTRRQQLQLFQRETLLHWKEHKECFFSVERMFCADWWTLIGLQWICPITFFEAASPFHTLFPRRTCKIYCMDMWNILFDVSDVKWSSVSWLEQTVGMQSYWIICIGHLGAGVLCLGLGLWVGM